MSLTSVNCPNVGCGRVCPIKEEQVGRRLRCPHCRSAFVITSLISGAEEAHATSFTVWRPSNIPQVIGRFRIVEWLGTGGFGTVYRAFDPHMQRDVALKVPTESVRTDAKADFLREARAAGILSHAHIVQVFEVSGHDAPPYIASAFIDGRTLEEVVASGPLPVRQAVRIVHDLADALAYAHEKGILHRDVKSSNVMLDQRGKAYLMDFGLACKEGQSDGSLFEDNLAGTPAYIAPEQIAAEEGRSLTASDQYSLGIVLYELLTGQLPFEGPAAVVLYNVVHAEPAPPRQVRPEIPRDLEAICLKVLAKDPRARYSGCAELAGQLHHWLDRQTPRPTSKKTTVVLGAGGVLVAILIGLHLLSALPPLPEQVSRPKSGTPPSEPSKPIPKKPPQEIPAKNSPGKVSNEITLVREFKGHQTTVLGVAISPDGRWALSGGGYRQPGDRTVRLWDLATGKQLRQFEGHQGAISCVAFSPDGQWVAAGSWDKSIHVWEVETGIIVKKFQDNPVQNISFSPDQRFLASAGAADKTVWLQNLQTGDQIPFKGHDSWVGCVVFSPDGAQLASGSNAPERCIKLWEIPSGRLLRTIRVDKDVVMLKYSPDGKYLASSCGIYAPTLLWSVETGKQIRDFSNRAGDRSVGFTPDGKHLVTGGQDGSVRVWQVTTGQLVAVKKVHSGVLDDLALSPDGRLVLLSSGRFRNAQAQYVPNGDYSLRLMRLPESVWPLSSKQ